MINLVISDTRIVNYSQLMYILEPFGPLEAYFGVKNEMFLGRILLLWVQKVSGL